MEIDNNKIVKFKRELEKLYSFFEETHEDILKILEDTDCVDSEKFDEFNSRLKDYESQLELIKSDFNKLKSENKKIESCMSETRILKKRRMTKVESNMKKKSNNNHNNYDMNDIYKLMYDNKINGKTK